MIDGTKIICSSVAKGWVFPILIDFYLEQVLVTLEVKRQMFPTLTDMLQ